MHCYLHSSYHLKVFKDQKGMQTRKPVLKCEILTTLLLECYSFSTIEAYMSTVLAWHWSSRRQSDPKSNYEVQWVSRASVVYLGRGLTSLRFSSAKWKAGVLVVVHKMQKSFRGGVSNREEQLWPIWSWCLSTVIIWNILNNINKRNQNQRKKNQMLLYV